MFTPIDVPVKRATKPVPVHPNRGPAAVLVSTRPTHRTPAATTPRPPSALLLPPDPAELEYGSVDYVHTLVEGTKLAMADREAWFGDRSPVSVGDLLDGGYEPRGDWRCH